MSNQLLDISPGRARQIDGPNYNELERMEEITARVKRSIDFSRRLKLDKAQLDFETAEELLQMLSDGLRTAKQLKEQELRGPHDPLRNHPPRRPHLHHPFPRRSDPDVRLRLAQQADAGWFTFDKAFEANQQLLQIEERQMDEIEQVKERWTRQGFNLAMTTHYEGWRVTMWHSLPGLHRPPFGRGATLRESLAAAEADLSEMLAAKGKLKV